MLYKNLDDAVEMGTDYWPEGTMYPHEHHITAARFIGNVVGNGVFYFLVPFSTEGHRSVTIGIHFRAAGYRWTKKDLIISELLSKHHWEQPLEEWILEARQYHSNKS